MRRLAAVLTLSLLAAACSKPAGRSPYAGDSAASADKAAGAPSPERVRAYRYLATIAAPGGRLLELEHRQEAACEGAGPAVCQVLNSQMTTGSGAVSGQLDVRATPAWLTTFRGGLDAAAAGAGGKVSERSASAEDITAQTVDVQARERAATAMRDRLQGLLDAKPANVHDLLDIEKELARVQSELDAAHSQTTALAAQSEMSEMTVTYADTRAAAANAWSMLRGSVAGGEVTVATSLSVLVTLAYALGPWVLVGLLIWFVVRLVRRNRPPAPRPSPAPPPGPPPSA